MEQNSLKGLSVYGYVRQNFEQKCHIQEIIATIIQFYINKGGFLYVCGDGSYGKLGIEEFYGRGHYGIEAFYYGKECKKPTCVQSMNGIIDIAAYDNHTMMIDDNGSLWAVGRGKDGRMGTGNTDVKVPRQIQLNSRLIAVSVGSEHSMVLTVNGAVLSCGHNNYGQLGHCDSDRQFVPKVIEALKQHRIIQISAGWLFNGALSENGDLFMWGNNEYGQCGVGEEKGQKIYTPTMVELKQKVSVIECGSSHSLITTMDSLLYSFGHGKYGRLGYDTHNDEYIPTLVESLKDVKIINVSGGGYHTLCVDDELIIWGFGNNQFGQCGHPESISEQLTPKKIEYFSSNEIKVKEVTAGPYTSCIITQNNECFVFGNNDYYRIGLKENKNYYIPTKLPLFVQKASMGSYHSTFIGEQQKD